MIGDYDVPAQRISVATVATMYNTERYRPIYVNKRGLPIFLSHA